MTRQATKQHVLIGAEISVLLPPILAPGFVELDR